MQTQTMTQKKAEFQAAGARRAERREKARRTAKAAGSGRWFLIGFAIPALIMLSRVCSDRRLAIWRRDRSDH
jgi:hypothetical protein